MSRDSPSDRFRDWEVLGSAIEVRLIGDPAGREVHEVWTARLLALEQTTEVDFETIGALTDALAIEDNSFIPPPYLVDYHRSYTSWGASGSSQAIVLQVAGGLVGSAITAAYGNAVYESLKAVVLRRVAEAQQRADWTPTPLGRQEAVERARWHLTLQFDLETDGAGNRPTLMLAGEEERSDGSRLVRFRDGDRLYEVELVDEAGLVNIGRSGWTER